MGVHDREHRRPRRVPLAAAALAAAALAVGTLEGRALGADAAPDRLRYEVRTWLNGEVPYYNAARDQQWAVRQAVRAWNVSGAGVRFVAVPRSEAMLTIRSFGVCTPDAEATLGWSPNAAVWIARRDDSSDLCNRYTAAGALAHELGHVLGLAHEHGRCAAMNPQGSYRGPGRCPKSPGWAWRCRLLEAEDLRRAVELYGGRIAAPTASPYCPLYEAISPPSPIRLLRRAGSRGLVVGFARPPAPRLPRFLVPARPPAFVPSLTRGRCAARPPRHRYRWDVRVGGVQRLAYEGLERGAYCLRVWSVDPLGRASGSPATSVLRLPS